jgi:sec-independent protein translocase protein TatB
MLDIGWSEMGLILLVALVVIGPKDLPRVARTVGKWSAKARGMAREFQRSLDDMAREAELQDIKAEIEKVNRTDLRARIEETVDPGGELRRSLQPPSFHGGGTDPLAASPSPPASEPAITAADIVTPGSPEVAARAAPPAPPPAAAAVVPATTAPEKV